MAGTLDTKEFRERMQRLEGLIEEVERYPDAKARGHTRLIVQSILDLHGAGLERILERLAAAGDTGLTLIDGLAQDDLVSSLLLLYGLHPLDLDTRVRQALDKVRPYLHAHHGDVELLGIAEGVVRLRMVGSCHGCPSSAMTLKSAIEEAIVEKAPDVTAIQVEGVTEPPPAQGAATFVPLEELTRRNGSAAPLLQG